MIKQKDWYTPDAYAASIAFEMGRPATLRYFHTADVEGVVIATAVADVAPFTNKGRAFDYRRVALFVDGRPQFSTYIAAQQVGERKEPE